MSKNTKNIYLLFRSGPKHLTLRGCKISFRRMQKIFVTERKKMKIFHDWKGVTPRHPPTRATTAPISHLFEFQ